MSTLFSWFGRVIAAFFRILKPKSNFSKEVYVSKFFTPEEVREKLQDRNFQLEMIDWIEKVLRPLEDDAIYLMVAQDRPANTYMITTQALQTFLNRCEPFILQGTPAHDLGHHTFDALIAMALVARDPFIATAYRNEIDAAVLAGVIHDIATGVQHRYVDNKWELNHGEIGAWIAYKLTEGLFIEPVRRLMAYMIAAHPHIMTKQPDGTSTCRWDDKLFFYGRFPVRIGVWVTRWIDRLSNGGDSVNHFTRHALAALDGARVGGMDLHAVDWYSFQDGLRYMFTPEAAVIDVDGKKIPTMLQHLKGYASSALARPYSAYNLHDDRSSSMRRLMDWKIANSQQLINIVTNTVGIPDFAIFENLMRLNSGNPTSPIAEETIAMVRDLWDLNTPEDQAHWAGGFTFAEQSYSEWLDLLQAEAFQASDPLIQALLPLIPSLVAKVS